MRGDLVENIPVDDYVFSLRRIVDVFVADLEFGNAQGHETPQFIIVISPQVDDLRSVLLHFPQDDPDEPGVLAGPVAGLATQVPGIDDITVEDKFLAAGPPEEIVHLGYLAIGSAQVDIGNENGLVADQAGFLNGGGGHVGCLVDDEMSDGEDESVGCWQRP